MSAPKSSSLPLGVRGHRFQNWAQTYSCSPEQFFQPKTEWQLVNLIKEASASSRTLKIVGSGHSPSDIACTSDWLVSLDKLNHVLQIQPIENGGALVRVQAGMKISALNDVIAKYSLGISNLGSISDQSVGGLIATVISLDLITADGRTLTCSESSNERIFKAALCSLGCLGVISTVTLKVEKAFRLEAVQTPMKLDDILQNLESLKRSAEHFRFWWFPHTDDAVTWAANRTKKPVASAVPSWFRDRFLGFHLLESLLYVSSFAPAILPSLNSGYYRLLFAKQTTVIDDSYKVFNFDCLFKQYVSEWAIPAEKTPEALRSIRQLIQDEKITAHFPIEVRFTQKDDIPLSPAYGHDVCFIGIIMYRPHGREIPREKYWKGFEDIMYRLGGRPHWAKTHTLNSAQLRKVYPLFDEFLKVREELDPRGLFANNYINRHLLDGAPKLPPKSRL